MTASRTHMVQICLAATLVLSSIGLSSAAEKNARNIICLLDFSSSIKDSDASRQADLLTKSVLPRMRDKDKLLVIPIDGAARTRAERIYELDMSRHRFSFPQDGIAKAAAKRRERLDAFIKEEAPRIQKALEEARARRAGDKGGTDILGAIRQAEKRLAKSNPEDGMSKAARVLAGDDRIVWSNLIVIDSDMLQDAAGYFFSKGSGPTGTAGKDAIRDLTSKKSVPDLTGTPVFINGRSGKNGEQIDNVESFWKLYFEAAHGQVVAYDFDSTPELERHLESK